MAQFALLENKIDGLNAGSELAVFEQEFVEGMTGIISRLSVGHNPRLMAGKVNNDGKTKEWLLINDEKISREEVAEAFDTREGTLLVAEYMAEGAKRILVRVLVKHVGKDELMLKVSGNLVGIEIWREIYGNIEEAARQQGYKFIIQEKLVFEQEYGEMELAGRPFFFSEIKPEKVQEWEWLSRSNPHLMEFDGVKFLNQKAIPEFILPDHLDLTYLQRRHYAANMARLADILSSCKTILEDEFSEDEKTNLAKDRTILDLVETLNNYCPVKIDLGKFEIEGGVNLYILLKAAYKLWILQKSKIALAVGDSGALKDYCLTVGLFAIYREKPDYAGSKLHLEGQAVEKI